MSILTFRGFTKIKAPLVFQHPSDDSILYASSKCVVVEKKSGKQEFIRTEKKINTFQLSPNGRIVAIGQSGTTSDLLVYRYSDLSLLYTLSEHDNGIFALAFSPDERLLASYGGDGRLIVWDMASGNIVGFKKFKAIHLLKFSNLTPEKTFPLAAGGPDGLIFQYFNPSNGSFSGENLPKSKYERSITDFAFTDSYLLCSTQSSDILIYDLKNRILQQITKAGAHSISQMEVQPNRDILAASGDGWIYSLSFEKATQLKNYQKGILGFSKNTVLREDGVLFKNGNEIWSAHAAPITALEPFISVSSDRVVKMWNSELKQEKTFMTIYTNPTAMTSSQHLLLIGHEDGQLSGFDIKTTEKLFDVLHIHGGRVTAIKIAPTRRFFVSGGVDSTLKIWDIRTRQLISAFGNQTKPITGVQILPSSTHVYSSSLDRSVSLYDIEQERLVLRLTKFETAVQNIAINGDQLYAVTKDGRLMRFTPSESLEPNQMCKSGELNAISVSPSGKLLAAGFLNGSVSIFESSSLRCLRNFPVHSEQVLDLHFIAEDKLMSASADGGIAVLSAE